MWWSKHGFSLLLSTRLVLKMQWLPWSKERGQELLILLLPTLNLPFELQWLTLFPNLPILIMQLRKKKRLSMNWMKSACTSASKLLKTQTVFSTASNLSLQCQQSLKKLPNRHLWQVLIPSLLYLLQNRTPPSTLFSILSRKTKNRIWNM